MKQVKWLNTAEGFSTKIGVYSILVRQDDNGWMTEIKFGDDVVVEKRVPTTGGDFLLGDVMRYFFRFLDSTILDKYMKG